MTPAQVITPAERAHRDSIRRKAFREREVRAIRAEHVRDSELTSEELYERFRAMRADFYCRHPELRP